MKKNNIVSAVSLSLLLTLTLFSSCERDLSDLEPATFPKTGDVFIDDFTGDLAYAAFGGSDVKAFQIEKDVTYNGSESAMRFEVPDANSPEGAYAGGAFFSKSGRDLSEFNALTFYIRASEAVNVGVLGFGNDFGANKYATSVSGVAANTNWEKIILPIPDPSKLVAERGLFFISSGAINGRGYTIWVDELKFENLTTISDPIGQIAFGKDSIINRAEKGSTYNVGALQALVSLPTGINQVVNTTAAFFSFESSDPSIASVSENGVINILDSGASVITAKLGENAAKGSITLNTIGAAPRPATIAPVPSFDPANVISMYTNTYPNEPVDTWNTRWLFSTAENEFIQIDGDDVIRYTSLNFVGIEFASNTIDATNMTNFHMNIWTPDPTNLPNNFKVLLVDFGANGVFGGGDDVSSEVTITSPKLVTNNWVTLDIPLANFTSLTTRAHLAQLVLSGTLPNVYVDNVLFHKIASNPTVAAPTPTYLPANTISVFSNTYTNIAGTDLNPNWGQATIVTQPLIVGNTTLLYSNLNYQGIQLGSPQNVTDYAFLHLDYFSVSSSTLKVFLISPGPIEKSFTLTVPTAGWNSVDIPLSSFAPVNLSNVIQLKFEGNGNVYLDNILFRK